MTPLPSDGDDGSMNMTVLEQTGAAVEEESRAETPELAAAVALLWGFTPCGQGREGRMNSKVLG